MKNILFIFLLFVSCTSKSLQVFPLKGIDFYTMGVKFRYFEVSNYDKKSDFKILNELGDYCFKNSPRDNIFKNKKNIFYFYERHFYINYQCDVQKEYLDIDSPGFYQMDKYLLSKIYFERTDDKKIIITKIFYNNHLIKLETKDTIKITEKY